MSLLDGENVLNNDGFFFFVNIIKCGIAMRDIEAIDNDPTFQDQFFLVPMTPGKRIFFETLQRILYDTTGFIRQVIYRFSGLAPYSEPERQSLISERGT